MSTLAQRPVGVPDSLLIDGQWRPSADGETFEVLDPANGDSLATVAGATPADAAEAVAAAATALPAWKARQPRDRAELLRAAFEAVRENDAELAALIMRENGKPLADARAEVVYAAEFLRWYAEEAVRLGGSLIRAPGADMNILVRREPIGVALLVTPWNLPLAMVTRKVGPALAAGCTAVLKPATATPLCALRFAQILEEVGVPGGVLNVIPAQSSGSVVAAAMDAEPVRKLSFTGSTEVGRILLAKASERVISCSMELGGNAPMVVFDDADLDLTIEAAITAKMRHNAEACTAANRIYVQAPLVDEFAERFGRAMAALRVGPGDDPEAQVGPLIDGGARDRVHELTRVAVDGGADVVTGGAPVDRPGFFYSPTVLRSVAADSPILAEEIFGPVAPIVSFEHDEEVVPLANGSELGLMAYVFSRDLARALRTADAIESGMVAINRGVISDPAAPFGGVKQSGVGREGGHEGILEYTEPKYIGVDW